MFYKEHHNFGVAFHFKELEKHQYEEAINLKTCSLKKKKIAILLIMIMEEDTLTKE